MLAMSNVRSDARVIREASELGAAGHRVTVVGYGRSGELARRVTALGVEQDPGLAPNNRSAWPAPVQGVGRWMLLPQHRRRVEAVFRQSAAEVVRGQAYDVVHAHDFNTLSLALDIQADHGGAVIYDSHECWTGRRLAGRPTPVAARRLRSLERRLGQRADAVLTVSDGIARWFQSQYEWDHVTVVRNTFPADENCGSASGEVRGVVYAGRVGFRRDLETLARAASLLQDLQVELVGNVDPTFAQGFQPGRAVVHPPVPIDDVDDWYRRAGLAAIPLADDCLNHRLALPNKLFQAVRAGVPVVAADLPELRRVVQRYDLGVLYRPGDPRSFADAVGRAVSEVDHYRTQVAAARDDLSWAVDSRALLDVYGRLASRL